MPTGLISRRRRRRRRRCAESGAGRHRQVKFIRGFRASSRWAIGPPRLFGAARSLPRPTAAAAATATAAAAAAAAALWLLAAGTSRGATGPR